jgi:hypothetical protein
MPRVKVALTPPRTRSTAGQILTAAADSNWTVIDMATDWSTVHPPNPA